MSTSTTREFTLVGGARPERPRSEHSEPRPGLSRDAGFRRLAAAVLRLDVDSLTSDLRAERQGRRLRHAA